VSLSKTEKEENFYKIKIQASPKNKIMLGQTTVTASASSTGKKSAASVMMPSLAPLTYDNVKALSYQGATDNLSVKKASKQHSEMSMILQKEQQQKNKSPSHSSASQHKQQLSPTQILKNNYDLYIQERASKLETKGKPLNLEMFKHYMDNFASIYASAHAFEEEVRK
jgi:hypothetical protein